jgi:putative flavoprotein involved in K+ transport
LCEFADLAGCTARRDRLAEADKSADYDQKDSDHDLHYRVLRDIGVILVGHFLGAEDGRAHFVSDLAVSVAFRDARCNDTREEIAKLCAELGIPLPEMSDSSPFDPRAPEVMDLAGCGAVIFTSGFRPDYSSWVHLDAFDELGFPIQEDGASTLVPGLTSAACTSCASANPRCCSA